MKEVSCRVCALLAEGLRRQGLPLELLTQGTGYELRRLTNKHERIDWDLLVKIARGLRQHWDDDDYIRCGGATFTGLAFRALNLIARNLFTVRDFYSWVTRPGSGGGAQTFSCIRPAVMRDLGPNKLELVLEMEDGYEPCREVFLCTLGGMTELPRALGFPSSKVHMEELPRGARFLIEYPSGGGALTWLRKAIIWPFTVRATARELQEANVTLKERYFELDQARARIDSQARQLRTAHRVSRLIHVDLALAPTLEAIATAMVEQANFAAAEVTINAIPEPTCLGGETNLVRTFGERPTHGAILRPLEVRGRRLGHIKLWAFKEQAPEAIDSLLEYVIPTVAMAVGDAVAFTTVNEYRENLEALVKDRTRELHTTITKLREAQEARERIFANLNHEIRTPLSLILLSATGIEAREVQALEPDSRQALAVIATSVRRMLYLVDSLLLLAAGEEGKLRVQRERRDLARLCLQVIKLWQPAALETELTLGYEGPERCAVFMDERAIERVLTNLISNAIKFTPSGGQVQVQLADHGDTVEIAVRDTGVGVPDEFRETVFERFEQAAPSVRPGVQGSGIGLAIVKELVEAHGGRVYVEACPGGGSRFRLSLPRRQSDAEVQESPRMRASHTVSHSATPAELGHKAVFALDGQTRKTQQERPLATVLVVEDDPDLRSALVKLLATEYAVLSVGDGLEALELAEEHLPDLLIADVEIPGIDGLELTRRFRALPGNRLAPTIILTAHAGLEDRLGGFAAGAVDYVSKPFDGAELVARVKTQMAIRGKAVELSQSEKLSSMGVLAAGLAHELRNPANGLVNAIYPLRKALPDEVQKGDTSSGQLLDVIEECSEQIRCLVTDLLRFTRPGPLNCAPEPLDKLLERAVALTRPAMGEISFTCRLRYAGTIRCVGVFLVQALINVLENAAQAAGSTGWIKLDSFEKGGQVILEVSDSGPGVPAPLRERIFEPFFTTKPPGQGTGLGLSAARQIVERHEGRLYCVASAGQTLFRIELPCDGPTQGNAEPPGSMPSRTLS